jgi:hypothetical protein
MEAGFRGEAKLRRLSAGTKSFTTEHREITENEKMKLETRKQELENKAASFQFLISNF